MAKISLEGTGEKKWKQAERALNQLARRAHKQMAVVNSAIPLGVVVDKIEEDGTFYRYMSAVKGRIDKIFFKTDWTGFMSAKLNVVVDRNGSTANDRHLVRDGLCEFDSAVLLEAGDQVTFSLTDIKTRDENHLERLWLSFSVISSIRSSEVKQVAMEALEDSSEILSD